jgi:hypothetical protein
MMNHTGTPPVFIPLSRFIWDRKALILTASKSIFENTHVWSTMCMDIRILVYNDKTQNRYLFTYFGNNGPDWIYNITSSPYNSPVEIPPDIEKLKVIVT